MTRENEKLVYELEEVLAALRQMEETILKELARYQEYEQESRESQSLADDEPSPNRSTARGR